MNATSSNPLGTRARRSLAVLALLAGAAWAGACSEDPVSTSVNSARAPDRSLSVTLPRGVVDPGDTVWLAVDVRRPCWEEDALLDLTVSWDGSRFAFVNHLLDAAAATANVDASGWAYLQLADRDGFGSGVRLAFRALRATTADGFVIESANLTCRDHGMIDAM